MERRKGRSSGFLQLVKNLFNKIFLSHGNMNHNQSFKWEAKILIVGLN